MRKPAVALASLASILSLTAGPSLGSQERPEAALTVVMRTDKSAFQIGEDIKVEAALVNLGEEAIRVYGELLWGPNAGFELHVATTDGVELFVGPRDHDFVVPTTLRSPRAFVRLSPGYFLGTYRTIPLTHLVPGPGTYLVYLDYLSPAPAEFVRSKEVWTRERGKMRTRPVTIVVLPATPPAAQPREVEHQ